MAHPDTRLTSRQVTIFVLYGVAVWFVAALLLRFLGPMGIYEGWLRVLVYGLIIPGTMPFVVLARRLGRARPGQLFPGFTLSSAAAAICDGAALAWIPGLYGAGVVLHAGAGGTILWGLGVGLILAYVMEPEVKTRV